MWNKKQSNFIKNIFIFILLILALISFYLINELNYKKIREIKLNVVEHPENLPTPEVAINSSFWFKNLKANLYRLEAIQYIWSNAVSSKYKKYLYLMLDVITELDPNFEHPYLIWELLLPEYNRRYEDLPKEIQEKNIQQWVNIGFKWVKNFCDADKLKAIKQDALAYNFEELKNNPKYKNPCKGYKIPYNLAFIYYFYLKKPDIASYYYRVSYANEDSAEWAKMMASIMKWKWWDREKSFFMFLNMASSAEDKNEICSNFSKSLIKYTSDKRFRLNDFTIREIQNTREKIFKKKKDKDWKIIESLWCENYLNKAVRELNLIYIENANSAYKNKFKKSAKTAEELLKKWFIWFLPTDPQSKPDHKIYYKYDEDLKRFDYN